MAHVAVRSEREVVVVASLTDPITCSLMRPLNVACFFWRTTHRMTSFSLFELERRFQRRVSGLWLVLRFCGVDLECFESHCFLVFMQFEGRLVSALGLDEV